MTRPTLSRPRSAAPSVLCGDLHLRFGAARMAGRVHWPIGPIADAALSVVVEVAGADAGPAEADRTLFAADLCRTAPALVIGLSLTVADRRGRSPMLGAGMAALGWAADHAEELGGGPGPLVVAGLGAGAAHAAWLAIAARDEGWPALRRQLLVHPRFDAVFPLPPHPAAVAPATVVTGPQTRAAGHAYAALLRRHGTEVRELPDAGGRLNGAQLLDPSPRNHGGEP